LVSEAFAAVDGRVEVLGEDRLSDVMRQPAARPRFAAGVLLMFAGAMLLLATLGVYGVFTFWVRDRTRELGVRRALGAQRVRLVGLVLTHALRVALVGAALGLLAAFWGVRLLETLLFGVPPTDPMTYSVAVLVSLATAAGAAVAPALRASLVDPVVSLRAE
jgi:ABC-type antimicrobial peptide transport system permease subunit